MQENYNKKTFYCLKNRFKRLAHLVGDCQLQIFSKTKHYQIPLIFWSNPNY